MLIKKFREHLVAGPADVKKLEEFAAIHAAITFLIEKEQPRGGYQFARCSQEANGSAIERPLRLCCNATGIRNPIVATLSFDDVCVNTVSEEVFAYSHKALVTTQNKLGCWVHTR